MTIDPVLATQPQERTKAHWNDRVVQKRTRQLALIPSSWHLPSALLENPPLSSVEVIRRSGILSPDELAWTEITDIRELAELVKTQRVTSEKLTTAYCKRAAIAQQLTKCLTEIFFDKALSRAKELDEHLRKTGEVVGPLHGIPISVKDRFDVEGLDTTVGTLCTLSTSSFYNADSNRLGWFNQQASYIQQLDCAAARIYGSSAIC